MDRSGFVGGSEWIKAVGESSSSVVDAVDSAVPGRCRFWKTLFSWEEVDILDGSPCIGCVSMGTGGGTSSGRGVDISAAVVGLVGPDNALGSVPVPSLPSPSRLLRSSKVGEPLCSFVSLILDFPETNSAVFRRDPLRLLMLFCWAVAVVAPTLGLGGGSTPSAVGDEELGPWSLLGLDRENMKEERLPERVLRWLVAAGLAFFPLPCFPASWSGLFISTVSSTLGLERVFSMLRLSNNGISSCPGDLIASNTSLELDPPSRKDRSSAATPLRVLPHEGRRSFKVLWQSKTFVK